MSSGTLQGEWPGLLEAPGDQQKVQRSVGAFVLRQKLSHEAFLNPSREPLELRIPLPKAVLGLAHPIRIVDQHPAKLRVHVAKQGIEQPRLVSLPAVDDLLDLASAGAGMDVGLREGLDLQFPRLPGLARGRPRRRHLSRYWSKLVWNPAATGIRKDPATFPAE
jgi:hypothetical protein